MKIARVGFDGRSVIIIGAGATRGASFVTETRPILPPLDNDFFTQAQRLSSAKPRGLVEGLIRDAVKIFGVNFKLTMEGFLTQVEQLANVSEDYKFIGHPPSNPYPGVRDLFLQTLAAVFDEAIGREPNCNYHRALVQSMSADDTIMSFNYDWLIDQTLRAYAQGKWNPKIGYGVPAQVRGNRGSGTEYWACKNPETGEAEYPGPSIALLKMHGALNWFPAAEDPRRPRRVTRLQLRRRWWHQRGTLRFEIAPPEWNKPIRSGIYQRIWRQARIALRDVRALCVIGYSLPTADLPAQALLTVDAVMKKTVSTLDLLVVVNPDPEARRRIRQVLRPRLGSRTRVLTFEELEHFGAFLDAG